MATYNLRINGNAQTVDTTDADKPLLYVLRELGLTAAKFWRCAAPASAAGSASAAPAPS